MAKTQFQELNELVQKLLAFAREFFVEVRFAYSFCPLQIRLELFAPSLVAFANGVAFVNAVVNDLVRNRCVTVFSGGAKRNPLIVNGNVLRNREHCVQESGLESDHAAGHVRVAGEECLLAQMLNNARFFALGLFDNFAFAIDDFGIAKNHGVFANLLTHDIEFVRKRNILFV